MLKFLAENWGSITVLLIVAGAAVFAVVKMYSDKKKGKSSCGCGCKGCPSAQMCHKTKVTDDDTNGGR